jgi:hypothetical protein
VFSVLSLDERRDQGSIHLRPPKRFPNLASFQPVEAESEIVFSKKGESFQIAQGILSPLRLPVPPRPHLATTSDT